MAPMTQQTPTDERELPGEAEAWARLLRGQRQIGAFTRWKEHDADQQARERLLRDLKVAAADQAPAA